MPLQIGFGGRSAEHARIGIDEGQILTLLGRDAWNSGRRRHRYMVYTGVTLGKHFVVGQRKALAIAVK